MLAVGLLASGQVSAQEAAQLARSGDMSAISTSLAKRKVDWLAASEQCKVFVEERTIEAASCATSDVSEPDGALQARAFMRAVGRATRELGVAIEGRERIRGSALLTEIEERAVCLLYTSDAADDMQCVDLGGRRIIKKALCDFFRLQET